MPKNNRQLIADAADILLNNGNHNIQSAKIKAAKQLNLFHSTDLPSNQLIEQCLLIKQQNTQSNQQSHLTEKRHIALQAMHSLKSFNVRLSGSVASGTADINSTIILYIYCDTPEEILFHLIDQKIPFKASEVPFKGIKGKTNKQPCFNFFAGNHAISLIWFSHAQLKQTAVLSQNTEPEIRLKMEKVKKLL